MADSNPIFPHRGHCVRVHSPALPRLAQLDSSVFFFLEMPKETRCQVYNPSEQRNHPNKKKEKDGKKKHKRFPNHVSPDALQYL